MAGLQPPVDFIRSFYGPVILLTAADIVIDVTPLIVTYTLVHTRPAYGPSTSDEIN